MSRPPVTRVLGVDFGDRRTGLAATDPTGTIVVPLPAVRDLDDPACAAAIVELARERDTEVIVVGMPFEHDGRVGARAQRTMRFVATLRKAVGDGPPAVDTIDESGTTDEAHARLKQGGIKAARRKPLADSVAAIVIVERYMAS